MRHRNRGRKLNRNAQHRNSLMRNLARALFLSPKGRIITTITKAKEVRPFVEKLVTLGRYGDEASRRRAIALLGHHEPSWPRAKKADEKGAAKWARIPPKPRNPVDRLRWRREGLPKLPQANQATAMDRLFEVIAPKFKDRPGGYTRILRTGQKRLNDKAELAFLEFVVPVSEPIENQGDKTEGSAKKGKPKAKAKDAATA